VLVRVLIGLAVLIVVGAVALVLERRRRATVAPLRDPFPVPRQLTRADFPHPEIPWLVALFSSATCDGCAAMHDRVEALASDDVAVVDVSWQDDRAVHERIEGVRAILWEQGFSRGSLIIVPAAPGVDGGAMAAVMAVGADATLSSLICSNDLTAIGAVRGLRSLGLVVPRQVSVVGFDDIEMAAHVDPPLTTVRQATDEMGHWAVASLLQRIDVGREATAGQVGGTPGRTVRLPVTLVIRDSTARPAELA